MNRNRLEALSDGVIAIAITIMVLELKIPEGTEWPDMLPVLPVLFSYVLSFIYVGIYWVNHHHLFQAVHKVDGLILWANLHLLFWLSLVPFVTNWVAGHRLSAAPVALYGIVLLMCSVSFCLLAHVLLRKEGKDSNLSRALGKWHKSWISIVLYALAIPLSLWQPIAGTVIYIAVAFLWFVPDRHLEKVGLD